VNAAAPSTRLRACRLGLLLLLAGGTGTPCAAAQPQAPKAALVVTRGEGAQDCPDSAALAERVRGVAGANVVSSELGAAVFETWVQVAMTRNFGGYSAQISTAGARHGSRTLDDLGPSCASLADAIAVTLAIFLDPYASLPPSTIAQPAPAPPRLPEPKAKAPPETPPQTHFYLDAGAGVTLNVLDHAMPLLAANAGLYLAPTWSLSLGGAYVLPDTTSSPGGEVELSLAYADLRGCGRALGESDGTHLDFCLTTMLGSLRGSGRGYPEHFSKHAAWWAVAVGPNLLFPITRSLSWILTGEAVLPVIRNGFDVQYNGSKSLAFRPGAVAGLISLGVRGDL